MAAQVTPTASPSSGLAATGDVLRGAVIAAPSGRPLPGALVRFFELRTRDGNRPISSAEEILDAGQPIGSAITDAKGQFVIPYSAPKGDVTIAFVVEGPDMGTEVDIVSWSARPRRAAAGSEAFLIGVDERRLARQRLRAGDDSLARTGEKIRRRREALEVPTPATAADRLANLALTEIQKPRGDDFSRTPLQVPHDADDDTIARLNSLVIEDTVAKQTDADRGKGLRGVPQRIPQGERRNDKPKFQARLGGTMVNRLSTINIVADLASVRRKAAEGRKRNDDGRGKPVRNVLGRDHRDDNPPRN